MKRGDIFRRKTGGPFYIYDHYKNGFWGRYIGRRDVFWVTSDRERMRVYKKNVLRINDELAKRIVSGATHYYHPITPMYERVFENLGKEACDILVLRSINTRIYVHGAIMCKVVHKGKPLFKVIIDYISYERVH